MMEIKLSPWTRRFLCVLAVWLMGFILVGMYLVDFLVIYGLIMFAAIMGMLLKAIFGAMVRGGRKIKELWRTKWEVYVHN